MSDPEDTAMRRRRLAAPSGLSFEDTIMRARVPRTLESHAGEDGPGPLDLYGFRLSGSDVVVVLDRPAYVGRRPKQPATQSGLAPRLVRVDSARSEVSSTHVELRQLGTTVVVTDLMSTNGSTVILPDRAPRTLRGGESMAVPAGTLVDIGDGNVIEILPLQQVG